MYSTGLSYTNKNIYSVEVIQTTMSPPPLVFAVNYERAVPVTVNVTLGKIQVLHLTEDYGTPFSRRSQRTKWSVEESASSVAEKESRNGKKKTCDL